MPKLMPNPLADIQKPLQRLEEALADVSGELGALEQIERELAEGFRATCERLDRIADLLEAQAVAEGSSNGRKARTS